MEQTFNLAYPAGCMKWTGSVWTRDDTAEFERSLDLLRSCGIREIFIGFYSPVLKNDFDVAAETARVGNVLRSHGMKAQQHHGLAPTFAPAGTSQGGAIEKLIRSAQYTANLGADVLVIHAGRADVHFDTFAEYDTYFIEEEKRLGRKRIIELLAANLDVAGEAAGKFGVKIAVENADAFMDLSLVRDLFAAVQSPHVGFCLDTGHAHFKCPPVTDWIDTLHDRLITTHVHDNRGTADEHLSPGFGTIPWIDVIQRLRKYNYSHTVTFETGGWPGDDPAEGFRCAIKFWRSLEYLASQKKAERT